MDSLNRCTVHHSNRWIITNDDNSLLLVFGYYFWTLGDRLSDYMTLEWNGYEIINRL